MNDFKIDPVKAAIKAHKNGDSDIHNLNDTCYSVCAAFQGGDSAWTVNPQCAKKCESLVECSRESQYGMSKCDHRRPDRPVLWDQTPHYFPDLYKKYKNVENALSQCNMKCKSQNLPNQCMQNCRVDSYAVETSPVENYVSKGECKHHKGCGCDDSKYSELARANPGAFWLSFFIVILIVFIMIGIVFKTLMK